MAELLDLSARIIDERRLDARAVRITNELSEVDDRIAMIESFSNVVVIDTDDGLLLFDASGKATAGGVIESLRAWSDAPVHTLVYTHGHVDHVGGSGALVADGRARGHRDPAVVGHENVQVRFDRYRATDGWNQAINARQFGGTRQASGAMLDGERFLPDDVAECSTTFTDRSGLRVGDVRLELRHARGETDDHAWAWLPEQRAIAVGDFLVWAFPNAGNPQKVQRYPGEWAAALREMAALEPELLLPAHGLPIGGRERIADVLDTIAGALEGLVADVVEAMNAGATLDEIVHSVRVDPDVLQLPFLRPTYDEPEFIVRNIWRLYGGWWDGDPAQLKPAPKADLATELAELSGGVGALVGRALGLSEAGDHRLACHLIELAVQAAPTDVEAHEARSQVYEARRRTETSLMAKAIYRTAASESAAQVAGDAG
ncbi:MAG: alkyl sulfatase dimerization domain-containing protein [Actinomycetota bacterium]